MEYRKLRSLIMLFIVALMLTSCDLINVTPTVPQTSAPTVPPTSASTAPQTSAPTAPPTSTPTAPSTSTPTSAPTVPPTEPTTAPVQTDSKTAYISFAAALNPGIANMDELFHAEGDLDGDGFTEIITAFGFVDPISDDYDRIDSCFALRSRNGKIELIKQDFCDGSAYEPYSIELVRFAGSDRYYIVVGTTNYASMNGLTVYEISGDDVMLVAAGESAVGVCQAWLSDLQSDGSYGGFTVHLSSYDVLYYPVTTYYKFVKGSFEQQDSIVDPGLYPAEPAEVVLHFLELSSVADNYPSPDITSRISEMWADTPDYEPGGNAWYTALFNYILGLEYDDEPTMKLSTAEDGQLVEVTVLLSDPLTGNDVCVIFYLIRDVEKWVITNTLVE